MHSSNGHELLAMGSVVLRRSAMPVMIGVRHRPGLQALSRGTTMSPKTRDWASYNDHRFQCQPGWRSSNPPPCRIIRSFTGYRADALPRFATTANDRVQSFLECDGGPVIARSRSTADQAEAKRVGRSAAYRSPADLGRGSGPAARPMLPSRPWVGEPGHGAAEHGRASNRSFWSTEAVVVVGLGLEAVDRPAPASSRHPRCGRWSARRTSGRRDWPCRWPHPDRSWSRRRA